VIATCSEDQTTCVWDLYGGEKRRTLTGHITAVTGVDWQLTAAPARRVSVVISVGSCCDGDDRGGGE
jgi:WD40 repeat protein